MVGVQSRLRGLSPAGSSGARPAVGRGRSIAGVLRSLMTTPGRLLRQRPALVRRALVGATAVLAVVAVGLVAVWWWLGQVADQRSTAVAETSRAVEELLTFDFRDADDEARFAVLAPSFRDEYTQSIRESVAPESVARGATVRHRVTDSAVVHESLGEVTLLLLMDRTETTAADPGPRLTTSSVVVTATRTDDRWLVSELATT